MKHKLAEAAQVEARLQQDLSRLQTMLQAAEADSNLVRRELQQATSQILSLHHAKEGMATERARVERHASAQHKLLEEVNDHLQQQHASYQKLKSKHAELEQAKAAENCNQRLQKQLSRRQQASADSSELQKELARLSADYDEALQQLQSVQEELQAERQHRLHGSQHEDREAAEELQRQLQLLLQEKKQLKLSVNEADAALDQAQAGQKQLLGEVSKLHAALQEIASTKHAWAAALEALEHQAGAAEATSNQVRQHQKLCRCQNHRPFI